MDQGVLVRLLVFGAEFLAPIAAMVTAEGPGWVRTTVRVMAGNAAGMTGYAQPAEPGSVRIELPVGGGPTARHAAPDHISANSQPKKRT